jgi:hypothetical protein
VVVSPAILVNLTRPAQACPFAAVLGERVALANPVERIEAGYGVKDANGRVLPTCMGAKPELVPTQPIVISLLGTMMAAGRAPHRLWRFEPSIECPQIGERGSNAEARSDCMQSSPSFDHRS